MHLGSLLLDREVCNISFGSAVSRFSSPFWHGMLALVTRLAWQLVLRCIEVLRCIQTHVALCRCRTSASLRNREAPCRGGCNNSWSQIAFSRPCNCLNKRKRDAFKTGIHKKHVHAKTECLNRVWFSRAPKRVCLHMFLSAQLIMREYTSA